MAKRDEGKTAYEKLLKKYADQVLAYVPEDKRAEAEAKLAGDALYDDLGEHVMMRTDYSKKLDEVRTAATAVNKYNEDLNAWHQGKQAELAQAAKLREELEALRKGNPAANQPPDPDDPVTTAALQKMQEGLIRKDEATKILNDALGQQANNLLGVSVALARITGQHLKNFDEPLDPQAVIDYAVKNKKQSVDAAYADMFREKYEERAAKEAEKKQEELEKKIRQKVEDEFRAKNPQLPYTISTEASLSPILDAMKKNDKATVGVDAALDEYYRMQRPQ